MADMMDALRRHPIILATVLVGVVVIVLDVTVRGSVGQWIATAFVALVVVWTLIRMVRELLRGHVGLDILAVVAMVATLAVGEYLASLIIVLMLTGGEALEDYASQRAGRELTALLDRSPQRAHRVSADGDEYADVDVEDVAVGDVLLVRPGEIVPVDGILLSGAASFDESSLTGESLPATRQTGDDLLSGSVNGSHAVRMRATRPSSDSQYQQIIALVREAQASRAPVTRLADRFAIPFTAVSLLIAGVAWAVSGTPVRFAEVLVLATPCPLLIAAPVAFLGGLSRSAKAGVIIKGSAVLEQLAKVRSVAFDKTGTLTAGRPKLVAVRPAEGIDADVLLGLAASAEQYSSHVLADGIREAATQRGIALQVGTQASEVATNGVSALVDGTRVVVGKPAYVASLVPDVERARLQPGQAAAYVAVGDRFGGTLVLADDLRPESRAVLSWLAANGVAHAAILTGDVQATAESIASAVGVAEVHAELLPPEKVELARTMSPRPVMMVGDGVNDAPVLAAADVGVAMGAKGATAAGDAADAVILKDSLAPLVDAVAVGRHTVRVAIAAIWIGIALSIGLMLVATAGVIPAVAGAIIQEFVDLATILYALRALSGPLASAALFPQHPHPHLPQPDAPAPSPPAASPRDPVEPPAG